MIQIKFKNLEKSELALEITRDRILELTEKFPDLKRSRIQVCLEMENSPSQPGPDLFSVKLLIQTGRYAGIKLEKSHFNIHVALAEVVDHMLERLNRAGDRARVKERAKARKIEQTIIERTDSTDNY